MTRNSYAIVIIGNQLCAVGWAIVQEKGCTAFCACTAAVGACVCRATLNGERPGFLAETTRHLQPCNIALYDVYV